MTGSGTSKKGANTETSQQAVVRFLSDANSFVPSTGFRLQDSAPISDPISVISTHSAHIFLVGNEVFKIKRSVRYSYLDMTSLQTRHSLCCRELELNRSTLPNIYLAVIPITQEVDGSFQINGNGCVVEWALHMNRFSENAVLDNMARKGELTNIVAERLGRAVALYHASLESATVLDGYARIHEVVEELIVELGQHTALFTPRLLNSFERRGRNELESCRVLLDDRARQGYVKRCHGDLHLRNLVLIDDIPVPFDALEFDERMATTDVLYDLAFGLMDLDHRSLLQQSNRTLNQYLLHSDIQTIRGMRLLPLFMFCRAGIRAMTTAQAASLSTDSYDMFEDEARSYLALALQYMVRRQPVLVAVGGLSGSGKSTLAASLAHRIGRPTGALLLRSDAERKVSQGVDEAVPLPVGHYTAHASHHNYQLLLKKAELALEAGNSVIIDAVFLDQKYRLAMENLAIQQNVAFQGLWLEAPVDVLEHRISLRSNDASDATVDVLKMQLQVDRGQMDWQTVDARGTLAQVLDQVNLGEPGCQGEVATE